MQAIKTANSEFEYAQTMRGKTLDEWVQTAHQYNCRKHGWDHYPLKKGAYGYDGLAMSLGRALGGPLTDRDEVARDVHDGWCTNYGFWRDHKPYERTDYTYHRPYKPIGDPRRNLCFTTSYDDLDESEKVKDLVFADFLLSSV